MRKFLSVAALVFIALTWSSGYAQTYPSRPIRVVVPFSAGGTADVIARPVGYQVGAQLGQSVIVDNRAGANGIIGTDLVAKAAPDGYTVLHVTGSFAVNPSIYRKLPYDIFKDFAPVTSVALGTGYLLLVNPAVKAGSVQDIIGLAKRGDQLTYSSPGVGNTLHLTAELFNVRAGIQMVHVPYKGVAPAMNAVVAGEVNVMFMPATVAMPLVEAGKLRALAFTGAARLPRMPQLPTMTEAGVPNFEVTGTWHGWFVPAKTPPAIVARLQGEVHKALQVPKIRDFIIVGGSEPDGRSPEAFRQLVKAEFERYAEMVRIANIPME